MPSMRVVVGCEDRASDTQTVEVAVMSVQSSTSTEERAGASGSDSDDDVDTPIVCATRFVRTLFHDAVYSFSEDSSDVPWSIEYCEPSDCSDNDEHREASDGLPEGVPSIVTGAKLVVQDCSELQYLPPARAAEQALLLADSVVKISVEAVGFSVNDKENEDCVGVASLGSDSLEDENMVASYLAADFVWWSTMCPHHAGDCFDNPDEEEEEVEDDDELVADQDPEPARDQEHGQDQHECQKLEQGDVQETEECPVQSHAITASTSLGESSEYQAGSSASPRPDDWEVVSQEMNSEHQRGKIKLVGRVAKQCSTAWREQGQAKLHDMRARTVTKVSEVRQRRSYQDEHSAVPQSEHVDPISPRDTLEELEMQSWGMLDEQEEGRSLMSSSSAMAVLEHPNSASSSAGEAGDGRNASSYTTERHQRGLRQVAKHARQKGAELRQKGNEKLKNIRKHQRARNGALDCRRASAPELCAEIEPEDEGPIMTHLDVPQDPNNDSASASSSAPPVQTPEPEPETDIVSEIDVGFASAVMRRISARPGLTWHVSAFDKPIDAEGAEVFRVYMENTVMSDITAGGFILTVDLRQLRSSKLRLLAGGSSSHVGSEWYDCLRSRCKEATICVPSGLMYQLVKTVMGAVFRSSPPVCLTHLVTSFESSERRAAKSFKPLPGTVCPEAVTSLNVQDDGLSEVVEVVEEVAGPRSTVGVPRAQPAARRVVGRQVFSRLPAMPVPYKGSCWSAFLTCGGCCPFLDASHWRALKEANAVLTNRAVALQARSEEQAAVVEELRLRVAQLEGESAHDAPSVVSSR
mmetsp:Transcript_63514/g.168288  ORF Transcript_63514/g.168288 Transcript_63514/m.168288 type:complete len:808 (-) Transcript_63514:31-2454(-)